MAIANQPTNRTTGNSAAEHVADHNGLGVNFNALAAAVRAASRFVCASSAPQTLKDACDYVCDGVDDQVQIQAALDTATGWVVLSEGVFNISQTIRMEHHGQQLSGAGTAGVSNASQQAFGTRIALAASFTDTAALRVALPGGETPNACLSHGKLSDFTIDGADFGSGIDGIHWRSHTGSVNRVRVARMSGHGIKIEGYTGWATYDCTFFQVWVTDCALSGIYCASGSQDDHFGQCVLFGNDESGFRIKGASHQIVGCHTYSNFYNFWIDSGGSRTKIEGCKIEQAVQHGIFVDNTAAGESDIQIIGNGFKNNGQSIANTYSHICFGGATQSAHSKPNVVGNNFSVASPTGGNLPRYCIDVQNSATKGLMIGDNSFGSAAQLGTGAIGIAGSPEVVIGTNYHAVDTPLRGHQRGFASVANGGVIPLSLAKGPAWFQVSSTVAGHIVAVTASTKDGLTVSIQDPAGVAVTTAENVAYRAEI